MMKNDQSIQQETSISMRKIGVIFCPRPGFQRRCRKMQSLIDALGTNVDYMKAEKSADAERIASIMTKNGYDSIFVVGGDTALNYALNGIMKTSTPGHKHPALGIIPAGFANDFAQYWGFSPSDNKLVDRLLTTNRRRRIDVGFCRTITDDGISHHDYFVNCINIGVAASIMGLRHKMFGLVGLSILAHLLSAFILLFKRMSYKLTFAIDGNTYAYCAMALCIGSAHGYGQTPSAVPYNGMLDISLVRKPQTTQLLHGLWLLFTGRFLSHHGISVWRTRRIKFTDVGKAPVSFDGRFAYARTSILSTEILPEEIEFIICP